MDHATKENREWVGYLTPAHSGRSGTIRASGDGEMGFEYFMRFSMDGF